MKTFIIVIVVIIVIFLMGKGYQLMMNPAKDKTGIAKGNNGEVYELNGKYYHLVYSTGVATEISKQEYDQSSFDSSHL